MINSAVQGAFYFPQGSLAWQGTLVSTTCFQLIADTLVLEGNPGINVSDCGQGEAIFGPAFLHLAE